MWFCIEIGILNTIFDGIQRPLEGIAELTNQNVFIPRGIELPCLDQTKEWNYVPLEGMKKGDLLTGGDIIGNVTENSLFKKHSIMTSPKISGKIVEVFPAAKYTVKDTICVVEDANGK